MTTQEILKAAKAATQSLALLTEHEKNGALLAMADALEMDTEAILAANAEDVEAVKGTVSDVMIDRLRLDAKRIKAMADGIRDVVALPDPVGKTVDAFERPNDSWSPTTLWHSQSPPLPYLIFRHERSEPTCIKTSTRLTAKCRNNKNFERPNSGVFFFISTVGEGQLNGLT